MRTAWAMFVRIPLRYTVVTLFCLLVVTLLAIGREGLEAIVPAAIVTGIVGPVLFFATRGRGRRATPARAAQSKAPPSPPQAAARVRSAPMAIAIQTAFAAEAGWRAIFGDGPDRTMSRLVGWAVTTGDDGQTEIVGLIVDPADPARIVPAAGVVTPEGQALTRYGFKEA